MSESDCVTIASFMPIPTGASQYPVEFIEARGAIKLAETGDKVTVGISEKADSETLDTIRNFHTSKVAFIRIASNELSSYLGNIMGELSDLESDAQGSGDGERLLLDKLANDAPTVNLVNSICIDGIRSGASDIHIEASPAGSRVRYRIDGTLRTVRTMDANRFPAVSSRVKIMSNLNILDRRHPQDGRMTVSVGNETVDLRVSIVPVTGGESIVLRILGKAIAPSSLEELGFDKDQLVTLRSLLKIPHGLVLVTGPTGSGKTTTLNAMIREIASESLKIITIEDPVEYIVDGVNQIQTNEQIDLGFDVLLRRVLRQDPNVIMVGEIRDKATAEIAVRAALTGHLVLSTLHTNDSVSVIPRLINMGIEPYLISSVLRGAIAQRLVRKLCADCSRKRKPMPEELRVLERASIPCKAIREPKGCDACGQTGFRGRIVVSEIFRNDEGLEDLITRNANIAEISKYLRKRGMKALATGALEKIANGQTTFREVEREILLFEGKEP